MPQLSASQTSVFAATRRRFFPRIHWWIVAAVCLGGFSGGLLRYAVTLAWPTPRGSLPWGTFTVNTAGAFVLGLLLVLVIEVLRPTTYLRPLIGTGFCGGLTTFSSVAVQADQLAAHGHAGTAVIYVVASVAASFAAALIGVMIGRSAGRRREKERG